MTKHTPGPWRIEKCDAPKRTHIESEAIDYHVAQVPGHGKQVDADSRLIAAAPEMLEMLKFIINPDNVATVHTKWGEGCNREEVDAILTRARALIQKIEGE